MTDYKTKLGHAHLKVRDLERSLAFYTRYFDLQITEQVGDVMVFLTSGDMHHEIALQARGLNAPAPHPYGVGLYHIAFEVPDKQAFAQAFMALRSDGVTVYPTDHRISWAMYFNDPDGNGLEIYVDTRHEMSGTDEWLGNDRPLTEAQIQSALATP